MLNKLITSLTLYAKNSVEDSACTSMFGEIKIPKSLRK